MKILNAGLQILYTLLQNVAQEDAAAQSFYQTYFCDILQHIFSVVTDTSHTAGEHWPHCLTLFFSSYSFFFFSWTELNQPDKSFLWIMNFKLFSFLDRLLLLTS